MMTMIPITAENFPPRWGARIVNGLGGGGQIVLTSKYQLNPTPTLILEIIMA